MSEINQGQGDEPNQDFWLALYDLALREEHHYTGEHHRRLHFFIGLISALLAATVAGVLNIKDVSHYLFLLTGPALALFVSFIGIKACRRIYQRFLEAVTMRVKAEYRLKLDVPPTNPAKNMWWLTEPFVSKRHLKEREELPCDQVEDSMKWLNWFVRKGPYSRFASQLFYAFAAISVVVGVALIAAFLCHPTVLGNVPLPAWVYYCLAIGAGVTVGIIVGLLIGWCRWSKTG